MVTKEQMRPTKARVVNWGDPFGGPDAMQFGVEVLVNGRWMNVCEGGEPVFFATKDEAKAYGRALTAMEQTND